MIRTKPFLVSLLAALLACVSTAQTPSGKPPAQQDAKGTPGQDKKPAARIDFQKQIWPIFEQRCIECHAAPKPVTSGRPKRPKGGVILDQKDGMLASKKGKLVIGKQPDESVLLGAIMLPADDEDRMPPPKEGPPLQKEQIALIRQWIEEGADFGTWTGAGDAKKDNDKDKEKDKGKDEPKGGAGGEKGGKDGGAKAGAGKDTALLQRLGQGLQPLGDDVLAAARTHAHIAAMAPGSPLLAISFHGREDEVTAATLRALAPLREHVVELCLARTPIRDEDCRAFADWPRLAWLDLRETAIGDQGTAALAGLRELRSLNLYGTKAGDAGVAALAACEHLENLYVYATPVSAQAVVALRDQIAALRVVMTADLPEPMAEGAARPRRRR